MPGSVDEAEELGLRFIENDLAVTNEAVFAWLSNCDFNLGAAFQLADIPVSHVSLSVYGDVLLPKRA